MGRVGFVGVVIGFVLLAAGGSAAAMSLIETPIDETDLSIGLPEGWQIRPTEMSAQDMRDFVEEFPSFAAQAGLRADATDAELTKLWRRLSKGFVMAAFDPRDNDTVSVAVYRNPFWPNMTAWRPRCSTKSPTTGRRSACCAISTDKRRLEQPPDTTGKIAARRSGGCQVELAPVQRAPKARVPNRRIEDVPRCDRSVRVLDRAGWTMCRRVLGGFAYHGGVAD